MGNTINYQDQNPPGNRSSNFSLSGTYDNDKYETCFQGGQKHILRKYEFREWLLYCSDVVSKKSYVFHIFGVVRPGLPPFWLGSGPGPGPKGIYRM